MSDHYETWQAEVSKQPQEKLTPERIEEIFERTTVFGSSNGWTGTAGTLATDCRELLKEREVLLREIELLKSLSIFGSAETRANRIIANSLQLYLG